MKRTILIATLFAASCAATVKPPAVPKPAACATDTWTCTSFGECSSNNQKRACTLKTDCPGIDTPKPVTEQVCTMPDPAPVAEVPAPRVQAAKLCTENPKHLHCREFARFGVFPGDYRGLCGAVIGGADWHRALVEDTDGDGVPDTTLLMDADDQKIYAYCQGIGAYKPFVRARPPSEEQQLNAVLGHQGDLRKAGEQAVARSVEYTERLAAVVPPSKSDDEPWFCARHPAACVVGGLLLTGAAVGIVGWQLGWFATTEEVNVNIAGAAMTAAP